MIKRAGLVFVVLLAVVAVHSPTRAEVLTGAQRDAIAVEAEAAYERAVALRDDDPVGARAAFGEAIAGYRQLLDDGIVSASLHYNLANAYLQIQDLGRAILHYRTALALDPGHARAQQNLAYARSLCERRLDAQGAGALREALLAVPRRFSVALRSAAALGAWSIAWLLVCLRLLGWRRLAPAWAIGAAAVASVCLILAVVSGLTWEHARPVGVVLEDEVVARKGDGTGFDPAFEEPLTAGVEVTVREDRGAWLRIALPDGAEGWLPAGAVGVVEIDVY